MDSEHLKETGRRGCEDEEEEEEELTLRQYSKISSLSFVQLALGSVSVTQRLFSSRYWFWNLPWPQSRATIGWKCVKPVSTLPDWALNSKKRQQKTNRYVDWSYMSLWWVERWRQNKRRRITVHHRYSPLQTCRHHMSTGRGESVSQTSQDWPSCDRKGITHTAEGLIRGVEYQ